MLYLDAGEIRSMLSSPRQRNSSRPATADPAAVFPFPANVPSSLPFNVVPAHPSSRPASSKPRPNNYKLSSASQDSQNPDFEEEGDDDGDYPVPIATRRIAGVYEQDTSTPSLLQHSKSTSIVHLDIVKRNIKFDNTSGRPSTATSSSTSGSNSSNTSAVADDGEIATIPWTVNRRAHGTMDTDSEEDEDIAITHSERFRMMSTSSSHQTSSLFKSRQNVLLKLQSKLPLHEAIPEQDGGSQSGNSTSRGREGSMNSTMTGKSSAKSTPRDFTIMPNDHESISSKVRPLILSSLCSVVYNFFL